MDAMIKTGFQSISFNIQFQPQTLTKGKNLSLAGHVRDVEEHRRHHQSYLIKSRVIRQASVHATPYSTSLKKNEERCVTEVSCDCVYNQSQKCKHVAALIYFINNEDSASKTSEEQKWGRPSARQFAKSKYSKGEEFQRMVPPKYEQLHNPQPTDISEVPSNSALRRIMAAEMETDNTHTVQNLVNSLVTRVEINLEKEDCAERIDTFFISSGEHSIYKGFYEPDENIRGFYLENIVLSDENIVNLGCETLQQSNCDKWHEARRMRFSASTNVHSIKIRSTKTIDSLVSEILNPKKINCVSTKYGLKNETHAKAEYKLLYNCIVKRVGVVVCKFQPWLCASVDGVVVEDECITELVEFKCPVSCEKKPVIDMADKLCNVKYLEFVNDKLFLKKSSPYYMQIQVQMYVSGMTVCDLFVYSPVMNGSCSVQVHRDEDFLRDVIPKSEEFYFQHYLPTLYAQSIAQNNNDPKINSNGNNNIEEKRAIDIFNNNDTNYDCDSRIQKRCFIGKDISNVQTAK